MPILLKWGLRGKGAPYDRSDWTASTAALICLICDGALAIPPAEQNFRRRFALIVIELTRDRKGAAMGFGREGGSLRPKRLDGVDHGPHQPYM
jgi:hypothetical protein